MKKRRFVDIMGDTGNTGVSMSEQTAKRSTFSLKSVKNDVTSMIHIRYGR